MPDGMIVVSDMGLARMETRDTVTLTDTMSQLGTYPYMAPEQINGDFRNADVRTDVYQLGRTLYELITKEVPTHVDLSIVPRGIRLIIERATKRLPDERYQQVRDLIVAVEQYNGGRPPDG
ncbi:hypothetical protein BE08_44960 [Sorangium cellulosum]|uniref:Protein kinase domain-containing protein n=1 Tax=Sorangium cellulosum TaxID=56 RepID=A0A150PC93_SORCE|nr:hypothetical protein BE08_44960 [Sorangium cellulosum]